LWGGGEIKRPQLKKRRKRIFTGEKMTRGKQLGMEGYRRQHLIWALNRRKALKKKKQNHEEKKLNKKGPGDEVKAQKR